MAAPTAVPTTYTTLYADDACDPYQGDYAAVMDTFAAIDAITSADLFTEVATVDPTTPNAYIGIFEAPGVVGGLSLVVHAIARFKARLGQPSQWNNRVFGFVQDVQGAHGDITTVELDDTFFRLTDGATTLTVPADAEVDALWDADPNLRMLPPVAAGAPNSRQIRTRHLMYVPPKYLKLVINRRLSPRELWTDLACAIADDGNLVSCRNLVDWILCAGVRPGPNAESASPLAAPTVPLGDAALYEHRRRIQYQQLRDPRADPTPTNAANAQMFALMGQVVTEQRLTREGAEAHRAMGGRTTKTPTTFWYDNLPQLLFLCGVDTEAELPRLWHVLAAASTANDRNSLDGHMRRLAVADNAHSQAPIVTPDLTRRLVSLNFAGNDRDDLALGIQPFNLVVTDPGDAEGTRLAVAATVNASEYDQLMLGGTSQALTDLRDLRTVAKISVNLSFNQAKRKLQALRLLLLGMLGAEHTLYQAYYVFLRTWIQQDDTWQARMRHPLAPAVLLRYVQLKLNVWFRQQEVRDFNPPVPPPNFLYIFDQLNEDCTAWIPSLPPAYLAAPPSAGPTPSRAPAKVTPPAPPNPGGMPVIPAGTTLPAAKARGTQVANTTRSPLLARFLTVNPLRKVADMIALAGTPPSITRGGVTAPMCVTFHLRGRCFSTCTRAYDHAPHTEVENAPLVPWLTVGLA